ncbi:MAG: hypothetical protein IJC30_01845 [Alphaproteobacteria bacterium]|nr:hypothetical protein [Alphaproteobacteria bacterium]
MTEKRLSIEISDEERTEILAHYKRGNIVRSELDMDILREAASIGNARLGFTVKKGEIIPTASLTEGGKFFLSIERKPLISRICSHATKKIINKLLERTLERK